MGESWTENAGVREQENRPTKPWKERVADHASGVTLSALRSANWLGLVLSAGALYFSLRRVQWNDAWAALTGLDGPLVALTVVTSVATTFAKAARWGSLLAPDRVSLDSLLFTLLVGQLANSLLPGRLGELARAYLLGERGHLGKARVLGTVLVEKLLDVVMLLALLLILLTGSAELLPSRFRSSALPLVGIALLLLLVMLLMTGSRDPPECLFAPLPLSWRRSLLQSMEGLRALRQVGMLGRALAWSALVWALAASTNYILLRSFRLQQKLPISAPVVVLVAIHLGALFPAAPAQIGVFHYLCLLSLTPFGVRQSMALGYAIVLHLVVYLPIAILGSLGLWRERCSLERLHWLRRVEVRSR